MAAADVSDTTVNAETGEGWKHSPTATAGSARFRGMYRALRALWFSLLVAASFGVLACGGATHGGMPSNAVVQIGDTSITRATLNHWMESIAGGDYFEHTNKRAPRGLVNEPANYARCASAARSVNVHAVSDVALKAKCQQLYESIKEQALSFLISVQWRIEEAAEQRVSVSAAELAKTLARVQREQFPRPGEFVTYLQQREWALSDELYQLRRNVLTAKLLEHVQRTHPGAAGELAFFRRAAANQKRRTAVTNCRTGYVVPQCRQYDARTTSRRSPSPAQLLEEITAST